MIAASSLIRVWVNRSFEGPQILCDEFIYAGLAKSFATTGHLKLGGGPTAGGSLLYSALIAPAWLAHKMSTVYGLAKAINATLISLTAVPVYLWARRVVSSWWALLAAGLVLLLTGLVLSGMLMSENAALPVFTFALFAVGLAVERPTLSRQALVLIALPLAYGARTQGLVLLAILPTAVLLNLMLSLRVGVPRAEAGRGLRKFAPLAIVLAIGFLAYLAHSGFAFSRAVGFYRRVATTHYDPFAVLLWTARHAGESVLALGVVPGCALLLLFLVAVTRGLPLPEERAFVATAFAAVVWFLVQTGAYASTFNQGILERYILYAFPPLLIAFVLWLARGLPRPGVETAIAVIASLALASLILFGVFLRPAFGNAVFSTLTLHLFTRVPEHVPGGLVGARVILFVLAAAAGLIFAIAPARFARPVLPAAVAVLLVLASHAAYGNLTAGTRGWADATGPVRSWIDAQVGTSAGTTAYLYVPNPSVQASSNVLAKTEFWNRSVGQGYTLGSAQLCPLPVDALHVEDRTGALLYVNGAEVGGQRYLVTDRGLAIAGKHVASGGPVVQPLAIYELTRPLRLASRVVGVYSDGWTGSDASFFQYWAPRPQRRRIDVALSRAGWIGEDVPGKVTVSVLPLGGAPPARPIATRHWIAHSGGSTLFRLPTPPPPFEVAVLVAPTFSPAQFGLGDGRQLGVQVKFSYPGAR
jgi:hypothetical protein